MEVIQANSASASSNPTSSMIGACMRRSPSALAIPLLLDNRTRTLSHQPVTVGIPFPKGILANPASLCLLDSDGHPILIQTEKLATWADGSVKWLLVDFVAGSLPAGQTRWVLSQVAKPSENSGLPRLILLESPDEILVETGAATFHLTRDRVPPFTRIVCLDKDVLDVRHTDVVLTDGSGHTVRPRVERVVVESQGTVRATLRYEGVFPGRRPLRFVARYAFFAGTGLVRTDLRIHNPDRARHRDGLWDLGDPSSILFRDLSVEFVLTGPGPSKLIWTNEPGETARFQEEADLEIYQGSSGGENWQSKNHVNRFGQVPCTLRGYRARTMANEESGLRANPRVTIQGAIGTITAAVPEFWQQFPKAIEARGQVLRLSLFPRQFGDLFELQGGEQKTHTIWLDIATQGSADVNALDWVHDPVRVHASPQWYAESGAFAFFAPTGHESDQRVEGILADAMQGKRNLFSRREIIDEYGWRHYGEIYADHENAYYEGPRPVISHYNNQYDFIYGALFQFFRSGDACWFDFLDPLARHVIDIDIYHTTRDRAVYNGGLFWHTDHYRDAATCTHRAYSRTNCGPAKKAYGGGPGCEHNYTTGLLHYFYVTGNPDARDAVLSLANWVMDMYDGSKTIFRFLDDGPAGWASSTDRFTYNGPGRGCGNSVNALLDGWLVTQQRSYLQKAEALIRRCVHPNDDVAARNLLNVESQWSYTIFFLVLDRYLRLKTDAEELDAPYAYARASLLRYAAWMVHHEMPYFNQEEKLEFPTEAWAAQELRKANVLQVAAQYADEPLRSQCLKRGEELVERAWSDLLRFPSRDSVRAIAILLSAGTCAAYFREKPLQVAPRVTQEFDFGRPEEFVPQKLRVLAQLKSVRGLASALLRLAGVR